MAFWDSTVRSQSDARTRARLRGWIKVGQRAQSAAEREALVQLAQTWLHEIGAKLPDVVVGSDEDVRRLAELVADLVLSERER